MISSDLRLTEDISNPGDLRFGFGIKYKVKTNITIQPSYVFRVRRVSGRSDRSEHRLRFDLTPKKDFRNLSVDNRSRLEHRIKHGGRNDDTFYRNRTRIRVPIKRDDKTVVTPFVYDDIWFDLQNARVFRNDLSGGISRKITKRFSADLFYRHRRNFRAGMRDENIFGLKIYLRFKKE